MTDSITPWWETVVLRDEIEKAQGRIDDVTASLHDAVFGRASGEEVPYHRADYYGAITHPTESLVEWMAKIAVRLGVPGTSQTRGVWRLDQGMGGGKSHGMIGLWHLATDPGSLAQTEIGRKVFAQAVDIAGADNLQKDLGNPACVILDCDNPAPNEKNDGPAKTLGERFLWRLFDGAYKKWEAYKDHTSNKDKMAEALVDVGRPVLILVDEVMDYIRWASNKNEKLVGSDMGFLRALLDSANKVENCALVVVMIASDKDRIALNRRGKECQAELEDLLTRNSQATTVSSGGDFADIIRRRLFQTSPPAEVTNATASLFLGQKVGEWRNAFDKAGEHDSGFAGRVSRSYPFHPSLITLAEDEWSLNTGFQRVRSTIQVFAAAVFALAERARKGEWTPLLIGPGDLPLSSRPVRDALLGSGLVADQRTQASLREVAAAEIVDPDHPERGTARHLDINRKPRGWNDANPRAAERVATAMFVYSMTPRPDARRGATREELTTATFVPVNSYGYGDAEVVFLELFEQGSGGLVAYDVAAGRGKSRRWYFETRKTLLMLHRVQKDTVTDEERNEVVTTVAFGLTTSGPFASVVTVSGEGLPADKSSFVQLKQILEGAGIDDRHKTRLIVLDSTWFTLFGDNDDKVKKAIQAAMGVGGNKMAMSWASSAVFVAIDYQRRRQTRGLATEYLAWRRVADLDTVQADENQYSEALERRDTVKRKLDGAVKEAYQHILYLGDDGSGGREMAAIRLRAKNQSALDGRIVWSALTEADKAISVDGFNSRALLHNLREADWGRPLSEIRDGFWNAPRLPLLPGGESDLRQALYDAIQSGDIVLVDEGDIPRIVTAPSDINFGASGIRIQRPDSLIPEEPPNGPPPPLPPPPPPPPPPPRATEQQVAVSATRALREDSERNAMRQLLNQIANAVDEDASWIQIVVKVTAPGETADKIVDRANEAGINPTVTDF